jgi:cytochrome d ubiquinol oxidase subunit I
VAFFLESTFIGLWVFGWNKISKKTHALSIWLVAIATNLSALWILLANGWMQHPVGYTIRNNRAEMTDFGALITNSYGWLKFFHTLLSGYVIAAFFVMGISAYHLLKKNNPDFFKRSFRTAATFGLLSSLLIFLVGDFHAAEVAKTQPTKFAAMESVWETKQGAAYNVIVIPDPANERNSVEAIGIPRLMSFLAFGDGQAEVKGLKEFPADERPPVMATFLSFKVMIVFGMLFMLLTIIAFIVSRGNKLDSHPAFLKIMFYALPLPYIAGQLGWIVAEVGRQPWIVYGVLKTSDAVSKAISHTHVWASLLGFTLLYGFLAVVDIYLLTRAAKKGPDDDLSRIVKTARIQEV